MKIEIPFGKGKIEVDIPDKNILDIISGESVSFYLNEDKIIRQALENLVESKKLSEIAWRRRSASIIASDITRPCPSYKFLLRLIEQLNKGGIENKNIKVIFGTGIHRKHTEDEKRKLAGDYVYENIKTVDSDASKSKLIGRTSRGTPLEVFEEALRSGLLIATAILNTIILPVTAEEQRQFYRGCVPEIRFNLTIL